MHNLQPENFQNKEELNQSINLNKLPVPTPDERKLIQEVERALYGKDWDTISARLPSMTGLLNLPNAKGKLLIERLIVGGAPEGLIEQVANLGGLEELSEDEKGDLLILAITSDNLDALRGLLDNGVDPNQPGSNGILPLRSAFLSHYIGAPSHFAIELLRSGARLRDVLLSPFDQILLKDADISGSTIREDLSGLDLAGVDLVDVDLSGSSLKGCNLRGATYSPGTKFPPDFTHPSIEGMVPAKRVFLNDSHVYLSERQLDRKVEEVAGDIPPHLVEEAQHLLTLSGTLQDVLLYREAYLDAVAAAGRGTGAPLQELAPKLLLTYPPGAIQGLFLELDYAMDQYPLPLKHHANEAELLLLCHHPKTEEVTAEHLASLSLALSSIDRWLTLGTTTNLTRETLYNWGRVGQLAFSFPLWKFEAMRTPSKGGAREPSLLEEFGFEFVHSRATDHMPGTKQHLYGPGFALIPHTLDFTYRKHTPTGEEVRDFTSEAYVEFRRSYLLISHPTSGTLLTRNSSKDFGRDTFPRTAYWSPKGIGNGLGVEDLQSITQENLHKFGFESILEPSLNDRHYPFQKHLGLLLDNLFALKERFSSWKFDTQLQSAWYQSPGHDPRLVGGYNSEGFPALVTFLERQFDLYEKGKISASFLPELAFVRPDLPPWASHEYQDEMEFSQNRFRLTRERLEVLRGLAEGRIDQDALENTGTYQFLAVGFATQSELVLLAPRE